MQKIVLASQSPRRKQLLEAIGLEFTLDPPADFDEFHPADRSALELVELNAVGKAKAVAPRYENAIIIGVDTVGAMEDHILEKPKDAEDAKRMLKMMQGTTHEVLTSICLINTATDKELSATETTHIEFLPMTDEQIDAYIKTGEPMDKAAAYGIQGIASIFIKKIDGDYFNVVGLPMFRLNLMLQEFDIALMELVK